jgi:hypothetical protein
MVEIPRRKLLGTTMAVFGFFTTLSLMKGRFFNGRNLKNPSCEQLSTCRFLGQVMRQSARDGFA